ncbi:MAG: bacteriocin [Dysgonamonadaceae bacterium]|jgi:bacteriocin-like protein|nr:bacteriocin [Dysgonamonadaceae bacterium]
MKKINLKGISETLSEKELKNVMGGVAVLTLSKKEADGTGGGGGGNGCGSPTGGTCSGACTTAILTDGTCTWYTIPGSGTYCACKEN